jgi:hypothetical protein
MIRLTIELFREPELPRQWRCVELDVSAAASRPDVAIEAMAETIRMTVRHEARLARTPRYRAI